MSDFVDDIISAQKPKVRAAIRTLEARGLTFCSHFGTDNAIKVLKGMDSAYRRGVLYEWLRDWCGIVTYGPTIKPRAGGRK